MLTHDEYTVGWICALADELAASQAMLDELHQDLAVNNTDTNAYVLGRLGKHNVVITCLGLGTMGKVAAATAAINLLRSFPKIRFGLMVGIGGGAPFSDGIVPANDIRLGDIVVSKPEDTFGNDTCLRP